jgi:hypothetical protein
MGKTSGQLAYEMDLAKTPLYHDGGKRRTWEQLGEIERWSWERPVYVDRITDGDGITRQLSAPIRLL